MINGSSWQLLLFFCSTCLVVAILFSIRVVVPVCFCCRCAVVVTVVVAAVAGEDRYDEINPGSCDFVGCEMGRASFLRKDPRTIIGFIKVFGWQVVRLFISSCCLSLLSLVFYFSNGCYLPPRYCLTKLALLALWFNYRRLHYNYKFRCEPRVREI